MPVSPTINTRSGMTLIELLIVLGLLAGLATMALTTTGDLTARSRYDVTRQRMDRVTLALAGDGQRAGRFVSDMGRLPVTLDELWSGTNTFAALPYTVSVPGYADLTGELHAGWSGPYILNSGDALYDGFGADFLYTNALLIAEIGGRATWLSHHVTNDYAHATNAVLHVQVFALRNNPAESVALWRPVQPVSATPHTWTSGTTNEPFNLYLYQGQVHVCLATNSIAPEIQSTFWRLLSQHEYMSDARVVLISPDTGGVTPMPVQSIADAILDNPVTFTHLAPGVRQVAAYGYTEGTALTTNGWQSGIQTIEIKPGVNFVHLHLAERLNP
jgi:prepilin-type N-terminal cleavage/methylation domain-containing protein